MYWLFNDKYFNHTTEGKQSYTWEQGRRFKGEPGDSIIMFNYSSSRSTFTSLLEIVEVEIKLLSENNQSPQRNIITLSLRLLVQFKEVKEMQDYLYSFPRIVYYGKRLYRHFNRKYYRLTNEEFDAITKDQIFEARTIIGTALNAMHIEHRWAFVKELIEVMPGVLQNKYRHEKVLKQLKEYFNYAVIKPAKQITDAFASLKGVIEEEGRQSMGFADESSPDSVDVISMQVNRIDQSLEDLESILVLNENYKRLNQQFEKIFKNRPLPIDLTE